MKISYNWIKWYVPEIPEPNRLADLFTYHICEVESVEKLPDGDYVFDLGILPNRAHDLLSHHGVARELSGLLGIKYNDPTSMYKVPASVPTNLKVEIQTPACRRYSARIVRNVKIGPSPEWVVKHLESIGQRSINNIVDATNIVMYDCGQPCHAFDLAKLSAEKIVITNPKEGMELPVVGRDAIVAKLKDTDIVIIDGEKNLALGGVKGGLDSGICDTTTDIVLEVANFDPVAVRKTARRLGLLSDSAKRFENDLSPSLCDFGMLELTGMILEILPEAIFEDVVDIYPTKQEERTLKFSKSYIDNILGTEVLEKEIENILTRYNYEFTKQESEIPASGEPTRGPGISLSCGVTFVVKIPLLRLDLVNREDMAEEIGRIYGLDKIKGVVPSIKGDSKKNEVYEKIVNARNILVEAGYREVMTYTFVDKGDIEVLASASDKKFLRTNLTDGLKQSYELNKLNAPLLGIDEIKIFEIGTVFTKNGEEIHVAWNEKEKIVEKKLENFTSQEFGSENTDISLVGNSSAQPSRLAQVSLNQILTPFKMWSVYPFITRDIAVWVPEGVEAEKLREIYKEFGTELLQGEPRLVDTFTKNGKTSYSFRLIFQSYDRTLTIDEVNIIMSNITEKLSSLDFEVR
jgi:phenylalanyl-tRNA synthetase beta chain